MVATLVTVLPLSKIQNQPDYNPISSLKNQLENDAISLYSFNEVTPEMIWQYGGKIQQIKVDDSTYNFPRDTKFGKIGRAHV